MLGLLCAVKWDWFDNLLCRFSNTGFSLRVSDCKIWIWNFLNLFPLITGKGKSKRFKRKFQGFSGLFCFSNRLINREIGIWRRSAVEPGREKRLRGCWTLSESADSVAQRAVVRAAFKSRMLPPPLRAPASQPSRRTATSSVTWLTLIPVLRFDLQEMGILLGG